MGDIIIFTPVSALKEDDMVDLMYDIYADPDGDNPSYEYEYSTVDCFEVETPTCIVVHFDGSSVGFPPDHLVRVVMVDR